MVLANVSPRVKKRFPGLDNLVEAGLLNDNEKTIIETMNKAFPRPSKHWLPIVWASKSPTEVVFDWLQLGHQPMGCCPTCTDPTHFPPRTRIQIET